MGPSDYFAIAWNRFDFLCVMASNLGLLIAATGRRDMQAALSLIRLIRIVRLFKLVKHISALERMFHAFFISLPRLFNVALVLCLMLYMFGVIAVNLFGGMQVTYELNERVNFRTFWHSVEEKFGEQNFRVLSEMRILAKIRVVILDFVGYVDRRFFIKFGAKLDFRV